jgi:hypothetical protein
MALSSICFTSWRIPGNICGALFFEWLGLNGLSARAANCEVRHIFYKPDSERCVESHRMASAEQLGEPAKASPGFAKLVWCQWRFFEVEREAPDRDPCGDR